MVRSRARRLLYQVGDGGVSLYGGFRSRRAAFLGHERTPIADARMGQLVKVVGQLRGNGRELRPPLSWEACVWYRTEVKTTPPLLDAFPLPSTFLDLVPAGKRITEEEPADLFVEDEGGAALVDARAARFSLVGMRSGWSAERTGSRDGRSGNARSFLERYAVELGRTVIYREVFLREGDRVAILGRPRVEVDPSGRAGFRTPATRIVFDEPGQVLVSDEPGVF